MKILAILFLIAGIYAIGLMYHIMSQTIWHDIMQDEFEERYEREIEERWRSQKIRIHAQMVIIDEMGVKE